MHSGTFCMHSDTFCNVLDGVEGCRKVAFQVDDTHAQTQTHGQTDICWDLLICVFAARNTRKLQKLLCCLLLVGSYIDCKGNYTTLCIAFICLNKFSICFALYSHFSQGNLTPSCIDFSCLNK